MGQSAMSCGEIAGGPAVASTDRIVQVEGLRFGYPEGDFSLGISAFEVRTREAVAVIGPSGSGKTTLLHLIAGIVRAREGRVLTQGVDVGGLDDAGRRDFRLRHIGLVFQEFELLEYLDVLDNILLPYRINASLRLDEAARERARGLAERLGIGDKLRRLPRQLSQGERQRAAVCRALVTAPALLLADEPTGNLDPANKGRVLDSLFDCAAESGTTLLAVTHDHEVLGRFDRVVDSKSFAARGGSPVSGSAP
jgi:putative ABC transport system ATP-binding protein